MPIDDSPTTTDRVALEPCWTPIGVAAARVIARLDEKLARRPGNRRPDQAKKELGYVA